jgi:uncharacterized protein YndB with AHSA1/START domain
MVRGDTTGAIVQVRRRVRAGAEEIFDLWTKPDLMVRWMSPYPGAVDCKASCDLRPGGAFSLVMSSEESIRDVSGTYVEVDRPRKLVFTWIGPLTNNVNTLVTVELTPCGDETDLVLTHERLPTPAICEGHTRGWGNMLDHMADTVSKDLLVDVEPSLQVMAGLVPAIHAFLAQSPKEDVDARDKPGHDDGERQFDRTETCSSLRAETTATAPPIYGCAVIRGAGHG